MTISLDGSEPFDSADMPRLIGKNSDLSTEASKHVSHLGLGSYDFMELWLTTRPPDDNTNIHIQVGDGSYATTNYNWTYGFYNLAASPVYGDAGAVSTDVIRLFNSVGGAVATEFQAFHVKIHRSGTTVYFHWTGISVNATATHYGMWGSGSYHGGDMDRLRFFHDGATDSWSAGKYKFVGYTL